MWDLEETLKKVNTIEVLRLVENDNDKILAGMMNKKWTKKHLQKFEEKNTRNPRAKV